MVALTVQRSGGQVLVGSMRVLLASTAIGCALAVPSLAVAQTLPTGGSVAAGSVAISQSSASHLNVTQSSQNAVVNWQGFSVGQGASVNFSQPNASSAILNRVTGSTPSSIAGSVTGNGEVYLVNPNGIAITKNGTVSVGGGFVASTLGISDSDFMNGNRSFSGNGASARVSNAGTITVGRGGYAALIGGTVSNAGAISVPLGKVALGSGEKATLDFSGDGFLQVAMPTVAGGRGALIKNSGSIRANGGSVIISAATAREAARNAVNISGIVQARSISGHNGSITIGGGAGGRVRITGRLIATSRHYAGGNITVTGKRIKLAGATVNASGATGGGTVNIGGDAHGVGPLQQADSVSIDGASTIKADATQSGNGGNVVVWSNGLTSVQGLLTTMGGPIGGNGGYIETSGHSLGFTGVRVDTSALNGSSGMWLLDPTNLTVDAATAATISSNLTNTDVQLVTSADGTTFGPGVTSTGAGDIIVNSAISWSSGHTLTLEAANAIDINANINVNGGGKVILGAAYDTTTVAGTSLLQLSFGNGASISFAAGTGTGIAGQVLHINEVNYTLIYSLSQFSTMDIGASAAENQTSANDTYYALAQNLTPASAYGSSVVSGLGGVFEGLGHTITGLTINAGGTSPVALFSWVGAGAVIRDLGLVGGSVNVSGPSVGDIAGIAGFSWGTISQVYDTGTVIGTALYGGGLVDIVGGLVGENEGSLSKSYATGAITGIYNPNSGQGAYVLGGLVGENYGTIAQSYATGAVNGDSSLGGLVGVNAGTIMQSYATGAVLGSQNIGGLVGVNSTGNAHLDMVFATGAISAPGENGGGLVGSQQNNPPPIVDGYYDSTTSGAAAGTQGNGSVGLPTRQLQGLDPISGNSYFSVANNLGNGTSSAFSGGAAGLYPYLTSFYTSGVQAITGTAQTSTGTAASAAQVALYSGGALGAVSTGVNGYFYQLVPAGTLASNGNVKIGAALTLRGATAVSGLGYTDGDSIAGGVLAFGTVKSGLNQQTTSETTYSALQTDLGTTFGASTLSALQTALASTPTSITGTGASFTLDQNVTEGAAFSLTTTATNAALTLADNLTASGQAVTLNSAGAFSQTGGSITAQSLTVMATTSLSNLTASVGGSLRANSGSDLTIGTISAGDVIITSGGKLTTTGALTAETGDLALTSAGTLSIGGTVTATAGDITLTTNGVNAALTLGGSLSASGDDQTVTLAATGTITQTAGTITADTLTGSAGGSVLLNRNGNAIGTLSAFTDSSGNLNLTDSVTNLTVSALVTVTAGSLTLGTTGSITLSGGSITTGTGQTYNSAIILGADTTLKSTGTGAIAFTSKVDGHHALTVNTAGTTTFDGTVGGGTTLMSLSVSGATALDGGQVTTSGTQTYSGAATLGSDTTLQGSTITFGSTLGGGNALTVRGNASFNGTGGWEHGADIALRQRHRGRSPPDPSPRRGYRRTTARSH